MNTRMPEHVKRYLESVGRISADGLTRKAHIQFCKRRNCSAVVIRGLDHDRCAIAVSVDPTPLTPVSELEALLSGGRTFELSGVRDHYRIDNRWSWHIAAHPAGHTRGDVVAEHRCGSAPPTSTLVSQIATAGPSAIQGSEPPF